MEVTVQLMHVLKIYVILEYNTNYMKYEFTFKLS